MTGGSVMHPVHLFADIGMLVNVGIHSRPLQGMPEDFLVKTRSARCDDDPVDDPAPDVFHDEILAGIGAHEPVGSGHRHSGDPPGLRALCGESSGQEAGPYFFFMMKRWSQPSAAR
jgi:hypothetical protein